MGELVWTWCSEELVFLPQRAIWRPQGRELLLADLHLGKAEARALLDPQVQLAGAAGRVCLQLFAGAEIADAFRADEEEEDAERESEREGAHATSEAPRERCST